MNLDQINHLSLVGRLTLNLASLNNEGTEGNAIQPRTATVVLDGKLHSVPVISGDMLKHWHAKHLSAIAQERGLPLSRNADRRNPNPNRIKSELADYDWVTKHVPAVNSWRGTVKGVERDKLERALYSLVASECVVTDAHGLLITEVSPQKADADTSVFTAAVAVARTSRVQVGFMTGVPRQSMTEHYFHAKYVSSRTGIQSRETASGEGQNIFTRPATSAAFAIVVAIDLAGLGFDDAENEYALKSEGDRRKRKQAVIDALSYTLMNQPGANSSQQFPHVMDFEGAIVTSSTNCPAPTVSAMKDDYRETLQKLSANINKMNGNDAVVVKTIESLDQAVDVLTTLSTGK
jgi:CRISPR-associated protein Cst2